MKFELQLARSKLPIKIPTLRDNIAKWRANERLNVSLCRIVLLATYFSSAMKCVAVWLYFKNPASFPKNFFTLMSPGPLVEIFKKKELK